MPRPHFRLACAIAAILGGVDARVAQSQENSTVISVEGSYATAPFQGKILFGGDPRTLSVVGMGKVSAAPDVAEISMGVVTQAASAREALAANNEAMAALHAVLKERGVAGKDVQTTQVAVNPQFSQPPPPTPGQPHRDYIPKIVGYQVTNTVRIMARDLSKLGATLDAVVQAGANQMHGIAFRVDKPEALMDQVRKNAMADAKHKAELLAGEARMVVGRPISIREEGTATPQPRPMMLGRRESFGAEAAVPISPGEKDLSLSVHVVYELKPPK